jgi:hypothetical protein
VEELKSSKSNQTITLILATILALILNQTLLPQGIIKNASAITTNKIGVYWDQNCTKPATSVNWGVLSPGDNKTITLYIRNEDNASLTLTITTINWNPEKAKQYLTLSCKQNNTSIEPQKTIKIQLTLQVKQNTKDIEDFSFDIAFEGKNLTFLPTDINRDGRVDIVDIVLVAMAYGSKPGDPNWNENADIDKNGIIDILDVSAVARDYGKTS